MRFNFTCNYLKNWPHPFALPWQTARWRDWQRLTNPSHALSLTAGLIRLRGCACMWARGARRFYLQVRVGRKVTKVAVGDYPGLNVNTKDPLTDVRL